MRVGGQDPELRSSLQETVGGVEGLGGAAEMERQLSLGQQRIGRVLMGIAAGGQRLRQVGRRHRFVAAKHCIHRKLARRGGDPDSATEFAGGGKHLIVQATRTS